MYISKTIKEALIVPRWRAVMKEEKRAFDKNDSWELVNNPSEKRPIGCKWVFNMKYRAVGLIKRYKSRLVVKFFTQTHGINNQETFALVAKMNSIRVVLSLAASLEWSLL